MCNRTFTGAGAQLELTTPLRDAMFLLNTAADRKSTITDVFREFVTATRTALA
ncbi:poly-gamma-glutamate hydrolase family protein [Actinoplanes sp. NPDC089786]|uniref:poly-gamma-glutamate hydrolase family protein n=1 Tax=Actinoplanes sp. NPDC089786 TaxID=3155185 RepID=UPI00342157B6